MRKIEAYKKHIALYKAYCTSQHKSFFLSELHEKYAARIRSNQSQKL